MMRKITLFILLACVPAMMRGQTARDEIRQNLRLSASNLLAYMEPRQRLTPAPLDMKPFYISHYGRHGSRYLISSHDYDYPYNVLRHADSLGLLTPQGYATMLKLAAIRRDARHRYGELTSLGAEQHRQIARRMYERFPAVFAGDVTVSARSTVVIRCILSMESALQQLVALNPRLRITHDASQSDMWYMNQHDNRLWKRKTDMEVAAPYQEFARRHDPSRSVLKRLVSSENYIEEHINAERFGYTLFKVASSLQNTELSRRMTLYDIFTDDEVYDYWLRENARFYACFGFCPLNGGQQPYSQRNLLRQIIVEADSCISLSRPGATLRFGHETMVLPLVCLLDLNGYGQAVDDFEQLPGKGWCNYKIFPMAANVQFVFYRRHENDNDILFKVLLNEDEATLPLPGSLAPYYRWRDFKEHYLALLDGYQE